MNGLHIVIPVKPFSEGKTRLSDLLSGAQRVALNRQLFIHTLERVARFAEVQRVTVVSRSFEALALARGQGLGALHEPAPFGLNPALRAATRAARRDGAQALLLLPVDLPACEGNDLRRLVDAAPAAPLCLLAPDHHGRGTNLMLQSPVLIDDYAFGPDSLARHQALAVRHGLAPVVVQDPVFAFDIDEPADYRRWSSEPGAAPRAMRSR